MTNNYTQPPNKETVTIPKDEYLKLLDDQDWLTCIEASGIEGTLVYERALRLYNDLEEE